jgi:hypothetical protein
MATWNKINKYAQCKRCPYCRRKFYDDGRNNCSCSNSYGIQDAFNRDLKRTPAPRNR